MVIYLTITYSLLTFNMDYTPYVTDMYDNLKPHIQNTKSKLQTINTQTESNFSHNLRSILDIPFS